MVVVRCDAEERDTKGRVRVSKKTAGDRCLWMTRGVNVDDRDWMNDKVSMEDRKGLRKGKQRVGDYSKRWVTRERGDDSREKKKILGHYDRERMGDKETVTGRGMNAEGVMVTG